MSVKREIVELLPASVAEIAAITQISIRKANSRLYSLKRRRIARPSERRANRSRIWEVMQ